MSIGKSKILWGAILGIYMLLPFGNKIADAFHSISFTISKYKAQHYVLPSEQQQKLNLFAQSTGRHNIAIENNTEHDHAFLNLFKGLLDESDADNPEKNGKQIVLTFEKHIVNDYHLKLPQRHYISDQKTKNTLSPKATSSGYLLRDTPPPQA